MKSDSLIPTGKKKKKLKINMSVYLPAGFTKLFNINSATKCDNEDSEGV